MSDFIRPLLIDDRARAAVGKVVEHALKEENYYEPGISPQPPGDDARHVVLLNTYRCVFSITRDLKGARLYRHLSISVPAKGKYPNVFAAFSIAELFGLSGWVGETPEPPVDWMVGTDRGDECVIVAQLAKDLCTKK
jgi:hypothetical protein